MHLWAGPASVRSDKTRHVWKKDRYLVLSTSSLTVFKSQSDFKQENFARALVIQNDLVQRILSPKEGNGGDCRVSVSILGRQSLELIAGTPEEAQTVVSWGTALEVARAQQGLPTLWKGFVSVQSDEADEWRGCRYLVLSSSTLALFDHSSFASQEAIPAAAIAIPTDLVQSILSPNKGCRVSVSVLGRQSLELLAVTSVEAQTLIEWGATLIIARAQQMQNQPETLSALWKGFVAVRSDESHEWRDCCFLVLSSSTLTLFDSALASEEAVTPAEALVIQTDFVHSILSADQGSECRVSVSFLGRQSLELIAGSAAEAQTLISWGTALEIAQAQQRERREHKREVGQAQSEAGRELKAKTLGKPNTAEPQFPPHSAAESKFPASKELTACDFQELIEAKQRDYFSGSREWLFQQVREWLSEPSLSTKRLFYVVGGAGTGKSVVSAQLLRTKGVCEYVKAWHFCRHDNAAGSAVRVILQSWAAMLSANLPGFKAQIQEGEVERALSAATAEEMFELLIAAPLRHLVAAEQDEKKAKREDGKVEETKNVVAAKATWDAELLTNVPLPPITKLSPPPPCVIVLDALDELPQDSVQDVLQIIAEEFAKLPSFVKLFVASRDEAAISERLQRFEHVKLEVNEFHNRADLKMYLAAVARRHVHLELSMEDFERELEREFSLAPLKLKDELKELEPLFQQSKVLYAAAVAPFQPSTSGENESYRGLCEVADIQPQFDPIKQCSDTLQQLYEDAKEAHSKLRSLFASEWRVWKTVGEGKSKTMLHVPVEGRAEEWVDVVIDPGLKSLESASRKIETDYEGDASRMKDLVRFTAQFADCARMRQFLGKLQQAQGKVKEAQTGSRGAQITTTPTTPSLVGVSVLSLKNKYSHPSALGYMDVNVTLEVRLADGRSHVCELQVNLEEMLKAKEQAHELYEKTRILLPAVCDRAGLASQVQKAHFEASLTKLLRNSVLETAVRELERKAGGLFLYASLLARHLDTNKEEGLFGKKVEFAALRGLPSGLAEIYEENLGRIVHSNEEWAIYSRLIALIIAAREPLPAELARGMIGTGYPELERSLSVLFPVREGRFQVMHKSVADWLQESGRIGKEELETAHRCMGRHFRRRMSLGSSVLCPSSNLQFCVRHVVYHLCSAGLWTEAFQTVSEVKWLLARAEQDVLGLVVDLEHAASFSASPHQPTIRLMAQALRMDLSNELYHDYRSVPTRLVGRLMGNESKEQQGLLEKLRAWEGPPEGWWYRATDHAACGWALAGYFQFSI